MPPQMQTPQSLLMEGRPVEALARFDTMLADNPRNAETLFGRATALKMLGRLDEARAGYDAVLALMPGALGALNNRGEVLLGLGQPAAALADFGQALGIKRDYLPALLGHSIALIRLGRPAEALQGLDQVLALMPDHADAWFHRGVALDQLGYPDKAVASYDKVLALVPTATAALANRGNSLHSLRRLEEALASFAAVEKLLPGNMAALNGQAAIAAHICDWSRHGEFEKAVVAAIRAGERDIHPGTMLTYSNAPEIMLANARVHAAPASGPVWTANPFSGPKISIAYCSADFHAHPMPRLLAGLFERHDRNRFEVIAISFGPEDGSAMRTRLKAAFDQFHDVRGSSDAAIADLIAGLGVDIAVDLMGYTTHSRPGVFARRPAPVQVSYMGYAGTLGAAHYDYIIADDVVAPPQHQPFYAEKIMALSDTYWVTDDRRTEAGRAPSRAEAGLPEQGFVFCCFNNNWKIGPAQFDIWMRLLHSVPGSVLWLMQDNPEAAANLRRHAAARGVAPERLVFAPRVTPEEHLARHRLAGLFLDTLPYGAHTTASDALWCGVPVVTCLGAGFPGRVAASILHAIGLPELITHNAADYESLALALASDAPRLAALKQKLEASRKTTALFDTARFTKNMEAAFEMMRDGFLKKA
jgi:predicted O-linked N-acetylglucosamine transferase (SPINDLY family)